MASRYKLLALDVDGTLLGPDHRLSEKTIRAVKGAVDAGIRVCIATGRSFIETRDVWRQLDLAPPYCPMVLIGGALVSEPDTGRTVYHSPIEREVAFDFADALGDAGYCAMAIVDSWRYGVDYYLAEHGDVHSAQEDWFGKMDVKTRRVKRMRDASELLHPLRISAVVPQDGAEKLAKDLHREFQDRLNVHAILAPNYGVTIVEAFSRQTSKFSALKYVAQAMCISPSQIAAVGDDVNDLAMIRGAGCGAAMPDSPELLRKEADVVVPDSLASFIDELAANRIE